MADKRKIIVKKLKTTISETGNLVSEDFSYQDIQQSIQPFGFRLEDVKIEVKGEEIFLIIPCSERTTSSGVGDFIL